jgi:multidrug efflux pump subunit AcrB
VIHGTLRARVAAVLDDLPVEADAPEIQKVDSNDDVIMWLNLTSDRLSVSELTDYAGRYLVDYFSVLDGVARVRIGGGQRYAMRIWLDRQAMAARNITVADVEAALRAAKAEMQRLNPTLPEGMTIAQSYDTSVFVEGAIHEVYKTLAIAIFLVVVVIYLFLGSVRATLIPAVTVPVSIVASFIVLYALDFSVNLLTLLALVLAIGLVVDDAILVLENIFRRMAEKGESPLVATYRGTRQVGFAVVATSLVLIAVFVPSDRQRTRRGLFRLHAGVHGRNRAPPDAICHQRRGHPAAGAGPAHLRQLRELQHRDRDFRSE